MRNKERKGVLAEVHFVLFYTAIFNALQSVLRGIFTRRVSNALWVKTEQLELARCVEIREAFEKASIAYYSARQTSSSAFSFRCCFNAVSQPTLRRRHMKLLLQVWFHELRIQFLENNKLPLTLRSEEGVLMNMVHISGTAWLMLTGGFCLIYFAEGLIANITHDPELVSKSMVGISLECPLCLLSFAFFCISRCDPSLKIFCEYRMSFLKSE